MLQEFDIRSNVILQDPKRSYTHKEKTDQLALQDYKCGVDGLDLNYEDAEAAHIISHHHGGQSTRDNMVMVRKSHNRDMGTMNLNDYKRTLDKN